MLPLLHGGNSRLQIRVRQSIQNPSDFLYSREEAQNLKTPWQVKFYEKEDIATQRNDLAMCRGFPKYSAEYHSAHSSLRKLPERIRNNSASIYSKPRIVLFRSRQKISRFEDREEYTKKAMTQQCGTIRLNC